MMSLDKMYHLSVAVSLFLNLVPFSYQVAIDNGVVGVPVVTCDEMNIGFTVTTNNTFEGRIFVKGEASNSDCGVSFAGIGQTHPAFLIPMNNCRVTKLRNGKDSIEFVTTVIVSFHPTFITKVDRAYKVHCFFRQSLTSLNVPLEVSMLTTRDTLTAEAEPVNCSYEIRQRGVNGPIVRYAIIGQPVFHVWRCDTRILRILVKNCVVSDRAGNDIVLIDEKGCSTDRYVLGNPTYAPPQFNTAVVEAHAFKYADKPSLSFMCQITLCHTDDQRCVDNTPPNCQFADVSAQTTQFSTVTTTAAVTQRLITKGNLTVDQPNAATTTAPTSTTGNQAPLYIFRQRRAVNRQSENNWHESQEIDLLSNEIAVLELNEIDTSFLREGNQQQFHSNSGTANCSIFTVALDGSALLLSDESVMHGNRQRNMQSDDMYCIQPGTFLIFVSLLSLVMVICVVSVTFACYFRRHHLSASKAEHTT